MSPHPFEPSPVRRAVDALLRLYPHFDLLRVDWQASRPTVFSDGDPYWTGPWVLVELGQPSERMREAPAWAVWHFAIWRGTGDVYRLPGPHGPVEDDPIITLAP